MTDLYENLLKATNNIDDITTEKYATVTKLNGNYCDAKEEDTGLEHTNVPIINGANLSVGDKAIIGFLNNSIYDVVCYGALDKTIHDDTKQDKLISGENIKTINHTSLLGSGNIDIQGGGSDVDIVTSWEPTPSDTKVPSEKLTKNTLDNKVDKVTGKGLSTNDFTNSYKNTIDGLSTVATTGDYDDLTDKPTIPSASTTTPSADTTSGSYGSGTTYARSNHTHPKSSLYAEATHSHTKSQITDFPTIPTKTSDLTNDGDGTNAFLTQHQSLANYVQKSSTSGLLKNDGSVDTTQYLSSLPSHNHDDRYYTESEVDTALNSKQNTLISGTNIKTINNISLLGSGNISVGGGGGSSNLFDLNTTSQYGDNAIEEGVDKGGMGLGFGNDILIYNSQAQKFYYDKNGSADYDTGNELATMNDVPTNSSIVDLIYPVGSIYMSVNSVNPSTLFGGTWEQIKDTFLLASGDTYANSTTGGSADATLVSHNHTVSATGEYFVTSENTGANNTRVQYNSSGNRYVDGMTTSSTPFHHREYVSTEGSSATGMNMPPYLVVNVWKRTA